MKTVTASLRCCCLPLLATGGLLFVVPAGLAAAPEAAPALWTRGELSAGATHTCLARGGRIACWGDNLYGKLGDGTEKARLVPVWVAGLRDAVAVAAGGTHSCALRRSGQVVCWGLRSSTPAAPAPLLQTVQGLDDAVEIVTGHDKGRGCARRRSGQVACWTLPSPQAIAVAGIADAVELVSGARHVCARRAAGTVACWGDNDSGQLGNGRGPGSAGAVPVPGLQDVVRIAAGGAHTCALHPSGEVRCWGYDTLAPLAQPRVLAPPTPVAGLSAAVDLAAGGMQTCARLRDRSIVCWGADDFGQLAVGRASTQPLPPTPTRGLLRARALTLGTWHGCALRQQGEVVCWGYLDDGQLGTGEGARATALPMLVPDLTDAVEVVSSEFVSCARRRSGQVACWGSALLGSSAVPGGSRQAVAVDRLSDATALMAGVQHVCARGRAGQVACWGLATFLPCIWRSEDDCQHEPWPTPHPISGFAGVVGAVAMAGPCVLDRQGEVRCSAGDGRSPTMQRIHGLHDVRELAASYYRACAIDGSGRLWCWRGEQPDGSGGDAAARVPGVENMAHVAVGFTHACALLRNGQVRCWGKNHRGQLGDGTTQERTTPVTVHGLTDVVEITAGDDFSCARRSGGAIACWGSNDKGVLGDGSGQDQWQPAAVRKVSDAVELDAGVFHVCARLRSGHVTCWGATAEATPPYRPTPTLPVFGTDTP